MEFGQIWYPQKATFTKDPTASVAKILDKNSLRTSGITEGSIIQA